MIEGKPLKLELDTGAAVSCISYEAFKKLGLSNKLIPTSRVFKVANGQTVSCIGLAQVLVKFRGSAYNLELHVIDAEFPVLFGRDWIREIFGSNWHENMVSMTVHQLKGYVFVRYRIK